MVREEWLSAILGGNLGPALVATRIEQTNAMGGDSWILVTEGELQDLVAGTAECPVWVRNGGEVLVAMDDELWAPSSADLKVNRRLLSAGRLCASFFWNRRHWGSFGSAAERAPWIGGLAVDWIGIVLLSAQFRSSLLQNPSRSESDCSELDRPPFP